jgi:hypothetical protein
MVLLAWSAGAGEPTMLSIVASAVFGALMGGIGGWALYRSRRRARLLRRTRRDAAGEDLIDPGPVDDPELMGSPS